MNRKEFLKSIGIGVAGVGSCGLMLLKEEDLARKVKAYKDYIQREIERGLQGYVGQSSFNKKDIMDRAIKIRKMVFAEHGIEVGKVTSNVKKGTINFDLKIPLVKHTIILKKRKKV